jgi:hypothetical protein
MLVERPSGPAQALMGLILHTSLGLRVEQGDSK